MTDISQLLNRHRSIRSYKPDPIDPALVEQVCGDAIAGGSSSGNLNSVSIVLTRDAERKRRLYELHFEQDFVLAGAAGRDILRGLVPHARMADSRRARQLQQPARLPRRGFRRDDRRAKRVPGLRGARDRHLLHGHDAALDGARSPNFLDLPDTCVPVTTIVAGWPAEDPPKRDRLPLAAFLHDEKYQRPTDVELEAIYEQREVRGWARYMAYPELKARIEEMGITSLAQFYTSKAKYDPDVFREDSAKLSALLEAKHFLP